MVRAHVQATISPVIRSTKTSSSAATERYAASRFLAMDYLRREHAGQTIALFTRGDVIKAVLSHYLHMSLDDLERFDISPASVSVIVTIDGWAQVKLVNGRGDHAGV